MSQLLVTGTTNLKEYPKIDNLADKNGRIVFGDMHGNFLKLINALTRHHLISLTIEQYAEFVKIAEKKASDLTKFDIAFFKVLLDKITFHKNSSILFIGDFFGDRGPNDDFNLLIYLYLKRKDIPVELILSNHDVEFILGYEIASPKFSPSMLDPVFHAPSMASLRTLIDRGLVEEKEVLAMIEEVYKPNLLALSYTLDEKGITIYTHARFYADDDEVDHIKELADFLSIEFKDGTALDLAKTIDKINACFKEQYVYPNKIHQLFPVSEDGPAYHAYLTGQVDSKKFPFIQLTWGRDDYVSKKPKTRNYERRYVHGHDPARSKNPRVINLDEKNSAGKSRDGEGSYSTLFTDEKKWQELDPATIAKAEASKVSPEEEAVPVLRRDETPLLEELNGLLSSQPASKEPVAVAIKPEPKKENSRQVIVVAFAVTLLTGYLLGPIVALGILVAGFTFKKLLDIEKQVAAEKERLQAEQKTKDPSSVQRPELEANPGVFIQATRKDSQQGIPLDSTPEPIIKRKNTSNPVKAAS